MNALWALWVVWLLSWLLASGWTAKTAVQQSSGSRIVQSLPVWLGLLLLVNTPDVLAVSLFPPFPGLTWLAFVLSAIGFAWTWWARIHLGQLWSAAVTLKAEHALIRSGPYRFTRHPIYSGLLLALFATALARDSVGALLGAPLILLGLVLKLRQEEEFLQGRFGSAYEDYRRDVPALVPRPW